MKNEILIPEKPCNLQNVGHSFLAWVNEYKPDHVSKIVLASLLDKYEKGDKEPIFAKFNQLIESEHYKLAEIFCSCFKYVGINDEFLAWANYA